VNSVRSGGWQVAVGGDLQGTPPTLALMGLANIGSAWRGGAAFGMKDHRLEPEPEEEKRRRPAPGW